MKLKLSIVELVGFCALVVAVCGSEEWGLLQVWVFAPSTAIFVDGVAIGACGSWELLWACVLSGDVSSPPGRSKELLDGGASFSSLMGWSEFGIISGTIASMIYKLCSWASNVALGEQRIGVAYMSWRARRGACVAVIAAGCLVMLPLRFALL